MRTYILPFDVFERIKIIDLDMDGKITQVRFSGHDIFFDIEYWWEGTIRVVTLTSDEIGKIEDNK